MPDNVSNDTYDDPDNILANTKDTVAGSVELPESQKQDASQSVYVPERDTSDGYGSLDEVDPTSSHELKDAGEDYSNESDPDADALADVMPADERDGTEG